MSNTHVSIPNHVPGSLDPFSFYAADETEALILNPFAVGDEIIVPAGTRYNTGDPYKSHKYEGTELMTVEIIAVHHAEYRNMGKTKKGKDRIRVISSKVVFMDDEGNDRRLLVSEQMCLINGKTVSYMFEREEPELLPW